MKKNKVHPLGNYGIRNKPHAKDKQGFPKGMQTGGIRADSYNEENNTVEVEFSRGARVLIQTWDGPAFEELDMSPDAVIMERLESGAAPVLDNHNRYGSVKDTQLGVVESARLQNGIGTAVLRLSNRESLAEFRQDVRDGIIKNVSVGYKRHDVRQMADDEETGYPVYRVIKWEPNEISFTQVGADKDSRARTEEGDLEEIKITNKKRNKVNPMNEKDKKRLGFLLAKRNLSDAEQTELTGLETRAEEEGLDLDSLRAEAQETGKPKSPSNEGTRSDGGIDETEANKIAMQAVRAERQRQNEIRDAVRSFGMEESLAQKLIDDEKSVDAARAEIQAKFAESDPHNGTRNVIKMGTDEADKERSRMADGIALRANPGIKLSSNTEKDAERKEAAADYKHYTLLDVAKRALEQAGVSTIGMHPMEIAKRAFTSNTADFPVLLEGTIRRVLLANYQAVQDTWRRFCAVGSVTDFRNHERIRMGSFSRLDKILENGEFKNKKITDGEKESIKAETFGNVINLSRQMIVNDDLDAFSRLPAMLGRAANRSIEIDVYALLALNSGLGPAMNDGNPLFHASHNNLGTGAALSVESIDADRVVMAEQQDPDSNDFLDLRPSVLVLPIGLGGQARILNDSRYDPDASNKLQKPNKVNGLYSDIVDTPRITGTRRYSFADPNVEPVLEVAFLNGEQSPFMDMMEGFDTDGVKWKVRMDYGVGAIGYRGAVTNAGQ